MKRASLIALLALATASCIFVQQPRKQRGAQCELNSECDAPLVCRLAACRKECATTRDCGIGQQCVLDANGLGACTLDTESHCAMNSECPAPLVCASTRCVNACNDDRDCRGGALCVEHGCVDPSSTSCVRDSECSDVMSDAGVHFVCTTNRRCGQECLTDRDCRFGTTCHLSACVGSVALPDGGAPDAVVPPTCPAPTDPCSPAPTPAVQLALGFDFTCARLIDGRIACWGDGTLGQLGTACAARGPNARPLVVDGITTAVDLVASSYHVCARLADGSLACWGRNDGGEASPASTMRPIFTPSIVALPGPARAVAAGPLATYAVVGGELYAWGDPTSGALGDGVTTGPPPTMPEHIGAFTGATGVSASTGGGCVVVGGNVSCWGANADGQAGVGDFGVVHPTPLPVPGLSGVTTIVASNNDACAMDPAATHCWGVNSDGELGLGTMTAHEPSPQPLALTDIVQLGVGTFSMCALRTGGVVTCWGVGDFGVLGDGLMTSRTTPTLDVVGLPRAAPPTAVAVGAYHACAIVGSAVYCWGDNGAGQLGSDMTASSSVAIPVACLP